MKKNQFKCPDCKETDQFRANVDATVNVFLLENGEIENSGTDFTDPQIDFDSLHCGCGWQPTPDINVGTDKFVK